ncbi:MAG: hypothetical protein KJP26_09635, partial [Maribacter sp.]|nr:hypothetical protein [Maribacter sp.]
MVRSWKQKREEGSCLHFSTVPKAGRFAVKFYKDYPNPERVSGGDKNSEGTCLHFSTVPTAGRFAMRVYKDYANPVTPTNHLLADINPCKSRDWFGKYW